MVPPNSLRIVTGECRWVITGNIILQLCKNHPNLLVPQSVAKLTNLQTPVKLCNPTHRFITLKKGYNLGYLEEVDMICGKESTADGRSGY